MGYTLRIGEAELRYEVNEHYSICEVTASRIKHKNAPSLGYPTICANEIWPSYVSWSNLCTFTNLDDLFFDEDEGILRDHSGCVPLEEKHRQVINAAYEKFMQKYPDAVPTFGKPAPEGVHPLLWEDKDNPECNAILVNLVWLKYWVNWALDNCEQPVFYNG